MCLVLGFSGKMTSGKDYTANKLAEYLKLEVGKISSFIFYPYSSTLRDEINSIARDYTINKNIEGLSNKYQVSIQEVKQFIDLLESDEDFIHNKFDIYNRTPNSRTILQYWGTDVRRNQDINYWVNKTIKTINGLKENFDLILITDVRYENEAEGVKLLNGAVIRCEISPEEQSRRLRERNQVTSKEELTHSSETSLDSYTGFDLVIDNSNPVPINELHSMLVQSGIL